MTLTLAKNAENVRHILGYWYPPPPDPGFRQLFRNVPNTDAQNVLPERSERAVLRVPANIVKNTRMGSKVSK